MLGGMISEDRGDSENGVPGLMDIPAVGSLFKKRNKTSSRTELIMLITPYIINDSADAEAATDAFQSTLGSWADGVRDRVKASKTARDARAKEFGKLQSTDDAATGDTNAELAKPALPPTATAPEPKPQAVENSSVPPAAAPAATPGRMINLTNRSSTPVPQANEQTPGAQPQPGDGSQPVANTKPAGKPAPAKIDGVNLPPGSTVVEDPVLLQEILKATKRN